MWIKQVSIDGENYVGLLGFATDKYAIISPNFKDEQILGVPTLKTKIYGTNLVGLFACGNSNGILLPYFTSKSEIEKIEVFARENDIKVGIVDGKYTALGNMICANDKGAIVSTKIRDYKIIEETLDVQAKSFDLEQHFEVGAFVTATNKGFMTHPNVEKSHKDIEKILKVQGLAGTVNCGIPMIHSGIIANSKGYITGTLTTGIELQRIDDALGFY